MFSLLNIPDKSSSKGNINSNFTMLINSFFFGIISSLLLLTCTFSSIIITISTNNGNFVSAQSYISGPNVYWKIPSSVGPREITWDPITNLFVIAGTGVHKIFTWDPATNAFATIAGSGSAGNFDSGSAGTLSRFRSPVGVTMLLSRSGSLVAYAVADTANSCLRRVEFSSPYLTSDLCGSCGNSGTDTGSCGSAQFRSPAGMDYGQGSKETFVADLSSHVVLVMSFIGASSNRRTSVLVGAVDAAGTTDGAATAGARLSSPFAVAAFPRSSSSSSVALFISTQGAGAHLRRLTPVSSSSGVLSTIVSLGSSGSNKGFGLSHIFNSGTSRGYMLWWNDFSGLVYFDLNSTEAESASLSSSNSQTIGFPCGNGGTNLIWPNFFDNNYSMLSILNSASSSSSDYDVIALGDGACGSTTTSTTTTTSATVLTSTSLATTSTTSTPPTTTSLTTTIVTTSPTTTTSSSTTTSLTTTTTTTSPTTTTSSSTTTSNAPTTTTSTTTTSTAPTTSSTATTATTSTAPTSSSTATTTTTPTTTTSSTTTSTPLTTSSTATAATTSTAPTTSTPTTTSTAPTSSSTATTTTTPTTTTSSTTTSTPLTTSSTATTATTSTSPTTTTSTPITTATTSTSSSTTTSAPFTTSSSTTTSTTATPLTTTSSTATTSTAPITTSLTSTTSTSPTTTSSSATTTSTSPTTTSSSATTTSTPPTTTSSTAPTTSLTTTTATSLTSSTSTSPTTTSSSTTTTSTLPTTTSTTTSTPFVSSTTSSSTVTATVVSTTNPTGIPTNTTTPGPRRRTRTRSSTVSADISNSSGRANSDSSAVLQLLATNGIRAWSTSLLILSVIAVPPLSYLIQIFASISVISGASIDSKSTELYRLIFPVKVDVGESFATQSSSNASSSTTSSSSSSLFTIDEIFSNLTGLCIILFGGVILNLILMIAIYLWRRFGNNNILSNNTDRIRESNDDEQQADSSGHWLDVCSSFYFPSTVIILFSFCLPGLSFGAGFLIAEAVNISNDNNSNSRVAICATIATIILIAVLVLFPLLLWKKTATGLEMLAQRAKIENNIKNDNESQSRKENQQSNVTPEIGTKASSGNSSLAASQIQVISVSASEESATSRLINGEGEQERVFSELEWKVFPFVEATSQSIMNNQDERTSSDSFSTETDSRPCCRCSASSPINLIITRGEFCGNFAQRWSAVLNIFSFAELSPFMSVLHPVLAALCCFLAGLAHLSDTSTIQNNNNTSSVVIVTGSAISIALSVIISALLFIFCVVMILVRPYRRPLLVVFVVLIPLATIFLVVEVAAVDFVGLDGLTFGQEQQNNNINASSQLGILMIGTIICWISVIIMLIVVGFEYFMWRKYFVSSNCMGVTSASLSNGDDGDDENSGNSSSDDDGDDGKNARRRNTRRNITSIIHVGSENSDDDDDEDDDEETNFFRDDDDEADKNNLHQASRRKIKIVRNPLTIPKALHAKHGSNAITKNCSSSSIDEEDDDDNKNESPRTRKEKIKFMKHVLGNTIVNLEASQNGFNNTASSKLSSNENNKKIGNVNDSLNSKLDEREDDDGEFDVGDSTQRLRVLAECLAEWKLDFSATHNHREPTVQDVETDPVAASLNFEYNAVKSSLAAMKKSRRKTEVNNSNNNNNNQNRSNTSGSPQRQMLDSFAISSSFMWMPPSPALQQQQEQQQLQKQQEMQLHEYQEELQFLKNEQKPLKLKLHHFRTDFLRQYGKEPTNVDYDKNPETKAARADAASNASLIKSFTEKLEKLMFLMAMQQQTKNNQNEEGKNQIGNTKNSSGGFEPPVRPSSASFGVLNDSVVATPPISKKINNTDNNTNSSMLASSSSLLTPEEIVTRKEHLGMQLVKWREQFSTEFKREPLVADMQAIPEIYSMYEEYLQLKSVIREKNLVEVIAAKSIKNNSNNTIKSEEEFHATQEKLQQTKKKINRWRRMFKAMNDNREPTDAELDLDPEMKTLVRSYVELKVRVGKAVSSGQFSEDHLQRGRNNNDEGENDGNNNNNNSNKSKSERNKSITPSKSSRSRHHRPSSGGGSSLNSSLNYDSGNGVTHDNRKFSASLVSTKCHDGDNLLNGSVSSRHMNVSDSDNNNNNQQRPSSNSSNNNINNNGRSDSRVRSPRTPGSRQQRRNHSSQRENFNGADYRHLALPERLKELNRALNRWKKNFVIEHGSAPTEDEMTRDDAVNNLYKEFVLVRKLNEDDETKKRLNRKLNVWRIKYKEKNGCAPTQDDLLSDPEIRSDYDEFLKVKERITQNEKQLADLVQSDDEEQRKRKQDRVVTTPAVTEVILVPDAGVTPPPPTRPSSSSEQQLQQKQRHFSSTRLEQGRNNDEKSPFRAQQQQQNNFIIRLKIKIEAANAKDKLDRKRQKELRKEIVAWKEKFKIANGGLEATHADIEKDMSILGAYAEYLKLQFEIKKKKNIFESRDRDDTGNSSGMAAATAEFVSSSNNMVDFSVKRDQILAKLQNWEQSFFQQFGRAPTRDDFNADTTVKLLVESLRNQLEVDVSSLSSPSSPASLSTDRRKADRNGNFSSQCRSSDNRSRRHAFDDDDDDEDSDGHGQDNNKNKGKISSSAGGVVERRRSFLMKQYDDDEVF